MEYWKMFEYWDIDLIFAFLRITNFTTSLKKQYSKYLFGNLSKILPTFLSYIK